ncbi:MAG: bifunctional 4-hydroxy-2-oxoglutarate aldolase/2-dehydro-3-deoxy-phosphogluconate aldolase, partial [Vibrio ordalii]
MLKALTAVYPVNFMPTGGVSPSNVQEELSIKSVLACGGTWMVPTDLMDKGDWQGIAELVKAL